jgi:SAM-dependent methyltransferase
MSGETANPAQRWSSGSAYEGYIGRWSRLIAPRFVDWLGAKPGADWLEVGCGTGALTTAIVRAGAPASVEACDPSAAFIAHARDGLEDPRVTFSIAGAEALPGRDGDFDAVVSGLVLNFLPDPADAIAAMRARLRPEGVVAAYVWDYGPGFELLHHFWDEAVAADPNAVRFDEARRFPLCRPPALAALFEAGKLSDVETAPLEIATDFADFDDYWQPFLGGTGPAPTYVASLDPAARDALRDRLRRRLPTDSSGRIHLQARAWAVRGART